MGSTVKRYRLLPLFALVALITLPGCFNLGRDAPVDKHFVLGGITAPDSAPRVAIPDIADPDNMPLADSLSGLRTGLRIGLRRVQLAEYLDSPLIVVRHGAHRIHYSEFNRWGGSLGNNIDRAVATYLKGLAPLGAVDVAPWATNARHDVLIQIHMLHLEGVAPADPMDADGEAHVQASWQIINPQTGAELVRGTTDHEVDGWTVGDYEQLVDLLDAGLWELSQDLVEALANQPH